VYYSVVGPNQDGSIEHNFSVLLEPGVRQVVITVGRGDSVATCRPPISRTTPTPAPTPATVSVTVVPNEEAGIPEACAAAHIPIAPSPTVTATQTATITSTQTIIIREDD
jgi:hypothetical protein